MNEGIIPNPAGIQFSMRVTFKDGSMIEHHADKTWKSTANSLPESWTGTEFDDSKWQEVATYDSDRWGNLIDFTFMDQKTKFARASLVKQHPFMKALGRPTRENVTTNREEQATLLQALELTNGDYFNGVLEEGASQWLERYGDNPDIIVETLYLKTLGRIPTSSEKEVILVALGDQPQKEDLQDLFWATLISPEFQFIN